MKSTLSVFAIALSFFLILASAGEAQEDDFSDFSDIDEIIAEDEGDGLSSFVGEEQEEL